MEKILTNFSINITNKNEEGYRVAEKLIKMRESGEDVEKWFYHVVLNS